jgi:hypothetical protein
MEVTLDDCEDDELLREIEVRLHRRKKESKARLVGVLFLANGVKDPEAFYGSERTVTEFDEEEWLVGPIVDFRYHCGVLQLCDDNNQYALKMDPRGLVAYGGLYWQDAGMLMVEADREIRPINYQELIPQ